MNSKEALCEILKRTDKKESEYTVKCAEIIVRDLEVLEILKKHIINTSIEFGSNYDMFHKLRVIIEVLDFKQFEDRETGKHCYPIHIDDDDFQKIKEWLENL